MTIAVLKPKTSDLKGDPLRVALADAIDASRKTDAAIESRRGAIVRATELVEKAERGLEAASAMVADARGRHAQAVAEAAAGGTPPSSPSTMRAARVAEVDAQDEVDAAKSALAQLEGGLPNLQEHAVRAESKVRAAVNAVVASAAKPFLEETRELQAELVAKRAILQFLRHYEANDETSDDPTLAVILADERKAPLAELHDLIDKFLAQNPLTATNEEAVAAWRQAREKLMRDAGAALPT